MTDGLTVIILMLIDLLESLLTSSDGESLLVYPDSGRLLNAIEIDATTFHWAALDCVSG